MIRFELHVDAVRGNPRDGGRPGRDLEDEPDTLLLAAADFRIRLGGDT